MSAKETMGILKNLQSSPLNHFLGRISLEGNILYLSKEAQLFFTSGKRLNHLDDLISQRDEALVRRFLKVPEENNMSWIPVVHLGEGEIPFMVMILQEQPETLSFLAMEFSLKNWNYLLDILGKYHLYNQFTMDIIITLTSLGKIEQINKNGLDLLGLPLTQVKGYSLDDFLVGPSAVEDIISRLQANPHIKEMEICLVSRDEAKEKVGLAYIYAVLSGEGEIEKIILFIRDISQRVDIMTEYMRTSMKLAQSNEDLKKTQTTLVNREKMASVGQLAAGLAHEINNPLGYISNNLKVVEEYFRSFQGFVDALEEPITEDYSSRLEELKVKHEIAYIMEDYRNLAREVRQGVNKIEHLMESLKVFSQEGKQPEGAFEDIHRALDSIIDLTYNEYKYNLEVVKEYQNIPDVYCHLMSLNQAFFNVFMNSIEAVKAQDTGHMGTIWIRTFRQGDFVYVEFTDDGGGVDEKNLGSVREPFFTTKPVGKGTGLGLSIVHEVVVENHHGRFNIENIGEGTRVTMALPINPAQGEGI